MNRSLSGTILPNYSRFGLLPRLLVVFAPLAMLLFMRSSGIANASVPPNAPVRIQWLVVHLALLAPFALLSAQLYRDGNVPFAHGRLWIPGILAGLGLAALAVRTGKLGESVAAHATTNALIAMQVLLFGQWQLW